MVHRRRKPASTSEGGGWVDSAFMSNHAAVLGLTSRVHDDHAVSLSWAVLAQRWMLQGVVVESTRNRTVICSTSRGAVRMTQPARLSRLSPAEASERAATGAREGS